jgi:hypothetical protein
MKKKFSVFAIAVSLTALSTAQSESFDQSRFSMKDYLVVIPEGWTSENKGDHLLLQNPRSGCLIRILAPQPSTGNLEQDANAVFDLMFTGWNYQQRGDKQYQLSQGYLEKGLPFFTKAATMSATTADGRYHLEEGSATVVKAGKKIVIISARHNSSELGHDACYRNYNTCQRFFNSFAIKNLPTPTRNETAAANRIIGFWKVVATGVVDADLLFAANGNYQSGGGIGASTITTDSRYEYIYSRAYPFEGDGAYSIAGGLLQLRPRGRQLEQMPFRFDLVNEGGSGWKDRLHLQKSDGNGIYEVTYQKLR